MFIQVVLNHGKGNNDRDFPQSITFDQLSQTLSVLRVNVTF